MVLHSPRLVKTPLSVLETNQKLSFVNAILLPWHQYNVCEDMKILDTQRLTFYSFGQSSITGSKENHLIMGVVRVTWLHTVKDSKKEIKESVEKT